MCCVLHDSLIVIYKSVLINGWSRCVRTGHGWMTIYASVNVARTCDITGDSTLSCFHLCYGQVSNGDIRANAATLFIDAFPILDPDANVVDVDSSMQKQFDELQVFCFTFFGKVYRATTVLLTMKGTY